MGEFDDLEEIDLHSSKEGVSARKARAGYRAAKRAGEAARQKMMASPRWRRQLAQERGWDSRRRKP
jgi:hypothetical protein